MVFFFDENQKKKDKNVFEMKLKEQKPINR